MYGDIAYFAGIKFRKFLRICPKFREFLPAKDFSSVHILDIYVDNTSIYLSVSWKIHLYRRTNVNPWTYYYQKGSTWSNWNDRPKYTTTYISNLLFILTFYCIDPFSTSLTWTPLPCAARYYFRTRMLLRLAVLYSWSKPHLEVLFRECKFSCNAIWTSP